jgi:hypothetical protein
MMSQVEIDPAQLVRAASGLDDIVKGEYGRIAATLRRGFPLEAPGLGNLLGPQEAYYNEVADYHVRSLLAAADAVGEIAAGLRTMARNLHASEEAHTTGMLATHRAADEEPARRVDVSKDRDAPLGDWDGVALDTRTQSDLLRISYAIAGIAPSYLPTPVAVSGLVANLASIRTAATELSAVAASLQTDVNAKFDHYAAEATVGWRDGGVEAYQAVIAAMNDELARARRTIDALSATLMATFAMLSAFWSAFARFTGDFFATVLRLRQTSPNPDQTQATLASLGAAASARWLAAHRGVLSAVATAVTQLGETVAAFAVGRVPGDARPEIQQISISWQPA